MKFLCQRGHKRDYVKTQINKAFNVPRKNTLYYQHKKSNNRTVFNTTYNPCLSNFNNIIKNIILFLRPLIAAKMPLNKDRPLLAYRRSRNLRDISMGYFKNTIPPPLPHNFVVSSSITIKFGVFIEFDMFSPK